MTSKEIKNVGDGFGYIPDLEGSSAIAASLLEIALQLALFNEYNARMEARYMELTAVAVRKQKAKGKRQKANGTTRN
jgi:hypothetical protein